MLSRECEYNKRHGVIYICTVDSERTDIMEECNPLAKACERAIIKESHRSIPFFKADVFG